MTIKNLLVKIIQIVTVALLIQTPLLADVYKWVDENGQINYSDRPQTPTAKKISKFKKQTKKTIPQSDSDSKSDANLESESESDFETTKEEKETAEKKDEKAAEVKKPTISKKEKRRLCKEGRDDYKKISSRGRMREISKKGEYTYLSEKQRQKRLASAKKKQRKYCR